MKKLIFGLLALGSLSMLACDDDKPIAPADLPINSTAFIAKYFPDATILHVEKDAKGYAVDLSNQIDVEFDATGEWIEVDGEDGIAIPVGFIPNIIAEYVAQQYASNQINGIEKTKAGYSVDLFPTDLDLYFDQEGKFIRIEN